VWTEKNSSWQALVLEAAGYTLVPVGTE